MKELIFILMGVISVGLFALGGTGWKWLRRFVMPVCLGVCLYILGVHWAQVALSMGILIGAMCMGYGESVNWIGKFLTGCMYVVPSLVIGFSWWVFIVPIGFIVLFILSNLKVSESSFTWKLVEMMWGLMIASSLISAYLNMW